MSELKNIAKKIIFDTLDDIQPEKLVMKKLKEFKIDQDVYVLSIGKAAWKMAYATSKVLNVKYGIVITKYGHNFGKIENFEIFEAGHPIPDENSLRAGKYAVSKFSNLSKDDILIFLISGGGSSVFELLQDGITLEDLKKINDLLLKSGANIIEINTIRKRLSKVKGGRFAQVIPAKIISLVLSDVLSNDLRFIASGPAYPDNTNFNTVKNILEKYNLDFDEKIINVLKKPLPDKLKNITHYIIGDINIACNLLEKNAQKFGFNTHILTTMLNCEAKEAGKFIASIVKGKNSFKKPFCLIFGGETVVKVTGNGLGGRNQELAYSAALEIEGMKNIVIASVGTDGTDGPTDAAGGIVDGETVKKIKAFSKDPYEYLLNNDSYNALKLAGDLLITGPTGTNLNDIGFILMR